MSHAIYGARKYERTQSRNKMNTKLGRSDACGAPQARARLTHAGKFLEVAELVAGEAELGTEPASASVSAALAVLAGIAASDAACCIALGKRSRGDDHLQAKTFLESIDGGNKPAAALSDLITLKDSAHYGLINISLPQLKIALRRAHTLVDFARSLLDAD